MRTVELLRHAEPLGAGDHRCLGSRSDPPLSAAGTAAASAMAKTYAARKICAVGTSPLLRCTQTAAALFPGAVPTLLPGLVELDCGDWDGLTFADIRARWPEHYARRGLDPTLPPPGGESPAHAAARAEAALRAFLDETEGDVVVVSHGGVMRALWCALTGTEFRRQRELALGYLGAVRLRFDGERFSWIERDDEV